MCWVKSELGSFDEKTRKRTHCEGFRRSFARKRSQVGGRDLLSRRGAEEEEFTTKAPRHQEEMGNGKWRMVDGEWAMGETG
jgi:hypothetical protein